MKKLHPMDWRNFRKKKHWYGIQYYKKELRKIINMPLQKDIQISLGTCYYSQNQRRKMMEKARYQTWEWYSNQ